MPIDSSSFIRNKANSAAAKARSKGWPCLERAGEHVAGGGSQMTVAGGQ
jgi:hypothetical protein